MSSKEAKVSVSFISKETFIHPNSLISSKPKEKQKTKNIEKKEEKFKQYNNTQEVAKEDKSNNTDVKIQVIEANINRLTYEK